MIQNFEERVNIEAPWRDWKELRQLMEKVLKILTRSVDNDVNQRACHRWRNLSALYEYTLAHTLITHEMRHGVVR